jgi:hypothetical protein
LRAMHRCPKLAGDFLNISIIALSFGCRDNGGTDLWLPRPSQHG